MSSSSPNHHDAELVLKCYELRRDPVMRQSRDALSFKFWPKTYDDLKTIIADYEHPLNMPWRQISSYWEMVYSFARRGAVNSEFFVENNGEGLFLFAKIQPFLEQLRAEISPLALQNTEWAATETEIGRMRLEIIKKRMVQMAK